MLQPREKARVSERQATMYASGSDFCRIFKEDMNNLYLLALLLTADAEKAEQCFVSGLDDCAGANQVFKEWARSWARRTIVQDAIRLVAPAAPDPDRGDPVPQAKAQSISHIGVAGGQTPALLQNEISAVLALEPFERFTFVISVLEHYSDQECALLLGCSRQSVIMARTRALRQIARSREEDQHHLAQAAFKIDSEAGNGNSILKLAIPARLATPA